MDGIVITLWLQGFLHKFLKLHFWFDLGLHLIHPHSYRQMKACYLLLLGY